MTAGIDRQARILMIKAAEDEAVLQLDGVPDGPFGFHVQQAIEKLFKALLCQLRIEFKFTHDLDELLLLLKAANESLPAEVIDLPRIGAYAVRHRYDDIPEFHVLDRADAANSVRILSEHIAARIAALSGSAPPPPVQ